MTITFNEQERERLVQLIGSLNDQLEASETLADLGTMAIRELRACMISVRDQLFAFVAENEGIDIEALGVINDLAMELNDILAKRPSNKQD